MQIIDKRKYFVFSEKILGYNPCEINTRNLNLLINSINLNSCLIAKIYDELSSVISQLRQIENALGMQANDLNNDQINSIISCFANTTNIGNPSLNGSALNGGKILINFSHSNNYAYNSFLFTIHNSNDEFIHQSIYFRNTLQYEFMPNKFAYNLNYIFKTTGMLGIILNNNSNAITILPKPPLPITIQIGNYGNNNAKFIYNTNLIVSGVKCRLTNSSNQIIHEENWGNSIPFNITANGIYKIRTYYINNPNIYSEKTININISPM